MISLSVNTGIINKEAFDGCQKGFGYRQNLSVDRLANAIHKGYAICAANLKNDYRLDANFISANSLILDFDNSKKNGEEKIYTPTFLIDQVSPHPLSEYCVYAYTSFSHTDDWHKFRLIFTLPYEIPDKDLYKWIVRYVAKQFDGADMTATSCTNIFFGNTNAIDIIKNEEAQPLPESLINEAIAAYAHEKLDRQIRRAESDAKAKRVREELLKSGRGDNTDEMVNIALTFIPQRIIGTGTYEDARNVCWSLAAHYGATVAASMMESHSPSYGTWDATKICEDYDPSRSDGIKGIGSLFAIAEKKFGFRQSDYYKKSTTPVATNRVSATATKTMFQTGKIETTVENIPDIERITTTREIQDFTTLEALTHTKFDPRKFLPEKLAALMISDAAKQNIDPVSFMAYLLPCAASLMGKVELDLGGGFKVPNIIWAMIIQKSGGGKSRAASIVSDQLNKWQFESRKDYEERVKEYKKALRNVAKDADEPERPKERKYVFNIATPQAVVRRFDDQVDNGCVWIRDELKGLFGGLNQFTNEGEGLEILLETWDKGGKSVDRVRGDSDSFCTPEARLSLVGGMQPAIIRKVFDPNDAQGTMARMLPVIPAELPAKRSKEALQLPHELPRLYHLIKRGDWSGINLSDEADDLFTEIYEHLGNLKASKMAVDAWQAKATGHVGRVAFVLHAIHCSYEPERDRSQISKDILQKAYDYVLLIRNWVLQMSGEMTEDSHEVSGLLKKILDKARQSSEPLAMRDFYRNIAGIRNLAKEEKRSPSDVTHALCQELVDLKKGELIQTEKGGYLFKCAIGSDSEKTAQEATTKQNAYEQSDTPTSVIVASVNADLNNKIKTKNEKIPDPLPDDRKTATSDATMTEVEQGLAVSTFTANDNAMPSDACVTVDRSSNSPYIDNSLLNKESNRDISIRDIGLNTPESFGIGEGVEFFLPDGSLDHPHIAEALKTGALPPINTFCVIESLTTAFDLPYANILTSLQTRHTVWVEYLRRVD